MTRTMVLAFALCATACGGTVVQGNADGGGSDASSPDGSPDATPGTDGSPPSDGATDGDQPWSPICPEDQPTIGSACSMTPPRDSPEILCEYGELQYDPGCDTVLTCEEGTWQNAFGPSETCQPDGPNSSSCPATYGDIDGGGSCTDNGLRCEYPQGVCTCSAGFGGPVILDGGTSWYCNPGPGCPMPRPRLGSSCTGNQQCTYQTCQFGESCTGGYWQGEFEGCAEPGGSP